MSKVLYLIKAVKDIVNRKQLLIVLPIVGSQYLSIMKQIKNCVKKYLRYCPIRIFCPSKTRLCGLFCFKNVRSKKKRSHIGCKLISSCINAI